MNISVYFCVQKKTLHSQLVFSLEINNSFACEDNYIHTTLLKFLKCNLPKVLANSWPYA